MHIQQHEFIDGSDKCIHCGVSRAKADVVCSGCNRPHSCVWRDAAASAVARPHHSGLDDFDAIRQRVEQIRADEKLKEQPA